MMQKTILLACIVIALLASCTGKAGSLNSKAKLTTDYELKELWRTDTLLRTPESVLYDVIRDVIYVSNINGNPSVKDYNGFISRLSTTGEILDAEWVKGLSAPKGMGTFGNLLFVADISNLIIIDLDEGKITDSITIEGATFLNDISVDMTGTVYITDSHTDKIHIFKNGKVSDWITGLQNPNGLYCEESRILLATSTFNSIDPETKELKMLTDSIGHGDGIEFTGIPGYYLVSDWYGEVFLIYPDYSKKSVLQTRQDGKNTADIGFILEDKILLVPTFFDNRVVAYELLEK